MPAPRRITDVAIDSALHQLREPRNGWRNHVPPEDLGQMFGAGSAQITLQALVAMLEYGPRPESVRKLTAYAHRCLAGEFMAAEPWSHKYGEAIVCCWLATVVIAEWHGESKLVELFERLLDSWGGTCRLMESDIVVGRGRKRKKSRHVLHAGCRSWGGQEGTSGLSNLWRIAAGYSEPPAAGSKAYGKPGVDDDWGWLKRCSRVALHVLRRIAARFPQDESIEDLLARIPRWGARTEFQLIGYADGSRLWIMGDDEPEFDDEDENNNTPGELLKGSLAGRLVALPHCPDPLTGSIRLRQTNSRADIDGTPKVGWVLWHSHLGQQHGVHPVTGERGCLSHLDPYTSAPLLFHISIHARSTRWDRVFPPGGRD